MDGNFPGLYVKHASNDLYVTEKELLVGFACGHVFHLSHVQELGHSHDNESANSSETTRPPQEDDNEDEYQLYTTSRTVGPKVITARLIRDKIGDGCRICAINRQVANAAAPGNA